MSWQDEIYHHLVREDTNTTLRRMDQERIELLKDLPLMRHTGEFIFAPVFSEEVRGWNHQTGWTAASVRDFTPNPYLIRGKYNPSEGGNLVLDDDTTWRDIFDFAGYLIGQGYNMAGLQERASRNVQSERYDGRPYIAEQEWWYKDTRSSRYSAVCLSYNGETFRPDRLFVADMAIPPLEKVKFPVYEMNSPSLPSQSPAVDVLVQKI